MIANVNIDINDQSVTTSNTAKGVVAVLGITERGNMHESKIIKSWNEFRRYFGGLVSYSYFPLYCKRALERGAVLRVARAAHYTDTSDQSTIGAVKATATLGTTNTVVITAKNHGTWGNDISVEITDPVSGLSGKVDIKITLTGYPELTQVITDVDTTPTADEKAAFNAKALLVDMGTVTNSISTVSATSLSSGTNDYGSIVGADYVGHSVGTGLHQFDDYDDFFYLSIPESYDAGTVDDSVLTYVNSRKDCLAVFRTPSNITGTESIAFRQRTGSYSGNPVVNNWRGKLLYGDLKVVNPLTENSVDISAIGDYLGTLSSKHQRQNAFVAVGGKETGRFYNNLGVVYNLGTAARKSEADNVDGNGINFPINHKTFGSTMWNASTLYQEDSLLKHSNVADLVIELYRNIKPLVEEELFQPNDIPTWRNIYRKVHSYMESVKASSGIYDFVYQGDQDIDDIADAQINNTTDIANGKYVFNLFVKPVSYLKYVGIQITLTNSDVDLEVLAQNPLI